MKKKIFLVLVCIVFALVAYVFYKVVIISKIGPDVEERIKKIALKKGLTLPVKSPNIVVKKAERKLMLYADKVLLKEYMIALGSNPVDDKQRQGDGCTPEGEFYICTKNKRSSFHLSIGINYPTTEDAERGYKNGLITQSERESIISANKAKEKPSWDTKLGGAICIHGTGIRGTIYTIFKTDWTDGCIALSNSDMDELFTIMNFGNKIIIEK